MNIQDVMMDVKDSGNAEAGEDHSVGLEVQKIMRLQNSKDKREEAVMQKKLIKYDEVYSIYALVENHPNKFKEILDELVLCRDEG